MRKCATCCYRAKKVRKCFPIVGNRRCNSQLMINSNLDICIIESDIKRLEPNSNKTNRILISFLVTILFLKLTKYPVCAVDKHVSSLPNSVSWYFGSHVRYFNANVFKSMFLGEEQIETLIYINERGILCAALRAVQLLPRTPRMVHLALSPTRFVSFMVSHVVF